MISWYISRSSSYAGDIDMLVDMITVLVGFWFILSEAAFFWFLWRYRHRKGVTRAMYVTGEEHEYTRWIHWPHYAIIACDLVIIAGAVRVWYNVKQDLPPADDTIRVIVAAVGVDVRAVRAPTASSTRPTTSARSTSCTSRSARPTTTSSTSLDVLHDFSVPVFRLKQDAIPGRVIKGWFKPTKTGVHDIQCAEICGIGHGIMNATHLHRERRGPRRVDRPRTRWRRRRSRPASTRRAVAARASSKGEVTACRSRTEITHGAHGAHEHAHEHHGPQGAWETFLQYAWSTDHKMIAIQYLFTGMVMALIGGFFVLRVPDAARVPRARSSRSSGR